MADNLKNSILEATREVIPGSGRAGLHEPELKGNEIAYLTRCIESSWVSYLGEYVERFELELAQVTNTKHAVVMVNGTVALHAALVVAGVKPDDEVLVPSLTFVASANAVSHCQAIPHFIDSEEQTLGLDPDALEAHLGQIAEMRDGACVNRQTGRIIRAVIPVHIFGHPVRMKELQRVASKYNLVIVEDAAESLGSQMNGRPLGGDGLMGVLSFNGNKIVTTGEGGAVVTNDEEIAARLKHLTTTAKTPHAYEFNHDEIAYNYRMPNINAAVGCAQLEHLDDFIKRKRQLADRYARAFAAIDGVQVFTEPEGAASNYWLNAILLDRSNADARNEVLEHLIADKLQCRPVWTPMHKLPIYESAPRASLEVCEDIAARLINLPSSPCLAEI